MWRAEWADTFADASVVEHTCDRMDRDDLERLLFAKGGKDGRHPTSEHRFSGARWSYQQHVVSTGSRNFQRALGTLLPDDITLPLMWAGLIVAALRWNDVTLPQALWGAVAGYLSLWLVYQAFKLLTGKEGMGYGDFKLFAALGAWFGWQALVPIILMASVIGAVVGIAMKFSTGLREGGYVPFGPFLAGAGLTAMIFGPASILAAIGL